MNLSTLYTPPTPFATSDDYAQCEALHRLHGTTYYYASKQFPRALQKSVDAVYGFVRVPDEWVDNPGSLTRDDQRNNLRVYRRELLQGLQGIRPENGVLRAFVDTMHTAQIPVEEPLVFLDAMEMDLDVMRYPDFDALCDYMRGSAAAVGVMMLYVIEGAATPAKLEAAKTLGNAMQLTNFLRDVGDDARRGRIYLPQDSMARFGVTDEQIMEGRLNEDFRRLMQFEIQRARQLYAESDRGIESLEPRFRRAVLLARLLYAQILDKVEQNGYDVFSRRARTTPVEKARAAAAVVLAAPWVCRRLVQSVEAESPR